MNKNEIFIEFFLVKQWVKLCLPNSQNGMKRWKLNIIDGEEKKEICVKNDEGKWGL